jgi:hypothetical protein
MKSLSLENSRAASRKVDTASGVHLGSRSSGRGEKETLPPSTGGAVR